VEGSKLVKKIKIKKNRIKSFQCPEQISQEEEVFIIFSKKL
jgi:hypothetical protein